MEKSVELMIGIIALVSGLSFLVRPKVWVEWFDYLRTQGTPGALMIGYLHLILGSFVLAFHWKWRGISLVITLIGVKAVIEGFIYMLFPNYLLSMLGWYGRHRGVLFSLAGVLSLAIAFIAFGQWAQPR